MPCLNEHDSLDKLIPRLHGLHANVEISIVDDGFTPTLTRILPATNKWHPLNDKELLNSALAIDDVDRWIEKLLDQNNSVGINGIHTHP